jgi:hypothetical protein
MISPQNILTLRSREAKVSIPERVELEYMLLHRWLQGDGEPNEYTLRLRLWQIANEVARHSAASVTALFGRQALLPRREILEDWVAGQMEAIKANRAELLSEDRQDDGVSPAILREILRGRSEARASSAVLGLNAELIEEAARGGGSSHYRWITQRDPRVRRWHAELDDEVFAWDSAPSGGGTHREDSGHPGSGHGCRCLPEPFVGSVPSLKKREPRQIAAAEPGRTTRGRELSTGYDSETLRRRAPSSERFVEKNASMADAQRAVASNRTEHGVIFDADEKMLARFTNLHKDYLDTDKFTGLNSTMERARGGATFIHNHPFNGGPLSADDFAGAAYHRLREIRAVQANGDVFIARPIGLPKHATRAQLEKAWRAAREINPGPSGQFKVRWEMRRAWRQADANTPRTAPDEVLWQNIIDAQRKVAEEFGLEIIWQRP